MYENQLYETILQRMVTHVLGENPDLDTREGSIIYNALAPAAVEVANMYVQLDTVLDETFADTSSRYYLIKRAAERGVYPYAATNAILLGEFNMTVPLGSRFSHETLNYVAYEAVTPTTYKMMCETPGSAGNRYLGQLIPIEYISGLTFARLTELQIPGDDEEETEAFRQRYFDSIDAKAFGGNIADYKEKTHALQGVGGAKIYPVWAGGGTVKVVIMDSTYSVPSEALVSYVQEELDPEGGDGGAGGQAVKTVNNIGPDENYNVALTADDIPTEAGNSVEVAVKNISSQMEDIANVQLPKKADLTSADFQILKRAGNTVWDSGNLPDEEGEWTPTLGTVGGGPVLGEHTYATQLGRWWRLGNRIRAEFSLALSYKDPAMAGNVVAIYGLPGVISDKSVANGVSFSAVSNLQLAANYTGIAANGQPNNTRIYLYQFGSNLASIGIAPGAIKNNTILSGNIEYIMK